MRSHGLRRASVVLLGILTLAAMVAAVARESPSAAPAGAVRVFDLMATGKGSFGPFEPFEFSETLDLLALPNGDIVALLDDRSAPLVRVDLQGRGRRLALGKRLEADWGNAVVAEPDGDLLVSERGRVLRRARDGSTSTVAGGPEPREASGDGGPAVGAGMEPAGLAVLPDGSLLIADRGSHRVRRVDAAGQISTVAGTGVAGSGGDGGPATRARLEGPTALSAFADGSYLILHDANHVRVRRVDRAGQITTVVGGGPRIPSQPCPRAPFAATSLRIATDEFPDVAALPDGAFLITAPSGLLRVSPEGIVTPVLCASSAYPNRADGRDLYVAGRSVADAFTGFAPSHVAVAADGSIIVNFGYYDTALSLLAAPGRSQRLGVAVAPGTVSAIFRRRMVIAATEHASVRVSVHRKRQLVMQIEGEVQPGDSELQLPRRLGRGVYRLRVLATTGDGRVARAALRVLGRPFISTAYARRLLSNEFSEYGVGEGTGSLRLSACRHRGPRRVRCRATGDVGGSRFREIHSIDLGRDGVLRYRTQSLRGRQFEDYAILP